jgi:hypothetical protein
MRKIILAATAFATLSVATAGTAEAGCYRLGLSGYHYYRSCIGPRALYPHRKYCTMRHGMRHCYYR